MYNFFPNQRAACSLAATLTHEVTDIVINAGINIFVNQKNQESISWSHLAFSSAIGITSGLAVEKALKVYGVDPDRNFVSFNIQNLVYSLAIGYIAEEIYNSVVGESEQLEIDN